MSARAAWRLETLGFTQVFRYTAGFADWSANGLPMEGASASDPSAGTLLRPGVPTCSLTDHIDDVKKRIEQTGWDRCVVVNDERIVLGLLSGEALESGSDAQAEDVMRPAPLTIRPDLSPEDALQKMKKRSAALVTTADGELLGVLRREDAEQAVAHTG